MKKKKIVNIIIIGIIFLIIIWLLTIKYKDTKIKDKNNSYNAKNIEMLYNTTQENIINEKNIKQYPKEKIIAKYKGYTVLAKLEIPKIKLETYILEQCTEKSLNKAVAKFWGANPNEERKLLYSRTQCTTK